MTQRRRKDRLGREIKTEADYMRMVLSAVVILIMFGGLFAGAVWLDGRYHYGQQVQLPGFLLKIIPGPAVPFCMPGLLAGIVLLMLMGLSATVWSRFYHDPKEELDEYGMYKHRG
jgi:hypothetical protein